MNPPRRWLDDPARAPDGALELLREAEPSTPPSPEALARVADRVTASATWNVPWARALGWKSAGALVGLAALTAALWRRPAPPRVAPPAPRTAQVVTAEPPRAVVPPRVEAPAPSPRPQSPQAPSVHASPPPPRRVAVTHDAPAPSPAPSIAVAETPVVTSSRGGGSAVAASAESLTREAAWLERVRAQLATSPDAALAQLQQHPTLFPHAQLAEEAGYLQFEALRRAGRTDAALRYADAWVAAHPRGLYADRMRRAADALR